MNLLYIVIGCISILTTNALVTDLSHALPHVLHSLPMKLAGLYAIIYGLTKDHRITVQGILLFGILLLVLREVEKSFL